MCLLLVAPVHSGTDLSAAVAHADFARDHPLNPVDLRWYGGVQQFGYSLWTQDVTAWLGARVAGGLGVVLGSAGFAALLYRSPREVVRRPLAGSLTGAVCLAAGMVSGRVTYAIGLAVGLLALLVLAGDGGSGRRMAAGGLALLGSAASPVAGLFVGLAGVGLLATGRRRDGLLLAAGAALPLALTGGLFGQGGYNAMSWRDAWTAAALSVAVLLAVPDRTVRVGAALSAVGVLAAWAVHTPVGLNATRLAIMFALPLVLACAPWRLPAVGLLGAALLVVRLPVQTSDLLQARDPVTTAAYFAPLTAELAGRAPTGRVEVVPTRNYWEAVYVAQVAPLARGWLRQQDTERNRLFFDGSLNAQTYHDWLADNGVQYVALPKGPLAFVGRGEGSLIGVGLPYLSQIWRGGNWVLYSVTGSPPLATGAQVLDSSAADVRLHVAAPGDVLLRVQDSRWLTLSGPGCLARQGRWLRMHARAPGVYVVGSRLWGGAARC